MKCKICLKDVENINRHVSKSHKIKSLDYFIKHEEFQIPKCKHCDKQAKHIRQLLFGTTCGSDKCVKLALKHTEESKQHLSEKRKEYLRNNKDENSWSKYRNEETEPEKRFRELIEKMDNSINVYQYFIPDDSDKFYEMDFAIPSMKIDFEINGEQHYDRDGNLASYYQDRHDYFTNLGWKVVEIHYSLCFNEEKIKEIILNTINDNISFSEIICNEAINHRNILLKNKQQSIYNKIYGNKIKKVQEEYDRLFLIADTIRENEGLGLINILSKKLNISHTQVRRLLKKYNLDIKLRKSPIK